MLGLIEVVTGKAGEMVPSHNLPTAASAVVETSQELSERPEVSTPEPIESAATGAASSGQDSEIRPSEDQEHSETPSTSERKIDPITIFLHLPTEELRKLCLLLGREGYLLYIFNGFNLWNILHTLYLATFVVQALRLGVLSSIRSPK